MVLPILFQDIFLKKTLKSNEKLQCYKSNLKFACYDLNFVKIKIKKKS